MTAAVIKHEQLFLDRFCNRSDVYFKQLKTGAYNCIREPLTDRIVRAHLNGTITIGLPVIGPAGCKWVCYDDDTTDLKRLTTLKKFLNELGFHAEHEQTNGHGKSGHLWIFFDRPVRVEIAFNFGIWSRLQNNIPPNAMEYFPKQRRLSELGTGNQVRMPLGIHAKTGTRGLFTACTSQDPYNQLEWLGKQSLNSADEFERYVDTLPQLPTTSGKKKPSNLPKENWLEWIPEDYPVKRTGTGIWVTACPVCRREGHDTTASNLSISQAGDLLFCHWNQGAHSFVEIARELKILKGNARIN